MVRRWKLINDSVTSTPTSNKSISWCGVAATLITIMAACDPLPPNLQTRARARQRNVAVIGPSKPNPVWPIIRKHASALQAAESGLTITFHDPKEDTAIALRRVIGDIAETDANAVIIFSPAVANCTNDINRLVSVGKRVVLIGTDNPGSNRSVYCGPSNVDVGVTAARVCAEMMPEGKQTVMILHGKRDRPNAATRLASFKEQAQREGSLEIFKELDCEDHTVEAQRILRRQSRLYPRVGAFVMLDDWAFRNDDIDDRLTPAESIAIVCGDSASLRNLLRARHIDCLISYQIDQSVEEGLRVADRLAGDSGEEALTSRVSPPIVVKVEDIDEHEARWHAWGREN